MISSQSPYLFVYGTLLSAVHTPISTDLKTNAHCIGRASFQGRLYLVNDLNLSMTYPGAIDSLVSSDLVFGEVYKLPTGLNGEALLDRLDRYEECDLKSPSPTEFVRVLRPVLTEEYRKLNAWIYLYAWEITHLERIESGDFLREIK